MVKLPVQVIESISYWMNVTGNDINKFIKPTEDLDEYALWLRKQVLTLIKPYKVTSKDIQENKDRFMDDATKDNDGSFYTPPIWAEHCHATLKKHVPNLEDFNVWDASSGTGNLIAPFTDCKQLFASTLFEEDVRTVQERLPHAYAFQCDFLSKIDYNEFFKDFTYSLPEKLQEVFRNDEPIIFHMNPPYATTGATGTDIGKHLKSIGEPDIATDLLRQFVWRVYNLIEVNKLTNAYISIVGTQSMYTLPKWESIVKVQQRYSDYIDGFVFKASEFGGISDSISWGIFYTLWKHNLAPFNEFRKKSTNIHMDFKENIDNKIVKTADVYLDYTREYVKDFLRARDLSDTKVAFPIANYKGAFSKTPKGEQKTFISSDNTIAFMLEKGSFKDVLNYLAFTTIPNTTTTIAITKENFKRCVAHFLYMAFYDENWLTIVSPYKKPFNVDTHEYDEWYYNSLLFIPFARKGHTTSFRNIEYLGIKRSFGNPMFPLSADEVRSLATDKRILESIDDYPVANEYFLEEYIKAKEYAWDSIRELYEFGEKFLRENINNREGNKPSDVSDNVFYNWDTGFATLRYSMLASLDWDKQYSEIMAKVRDEVRSKQKKYYPMLQSELEASK